jgi:propanol-preferring alcohol dehydrogenase
MRIIAIDGGDEKRDLCKRLGAEEFIDFTKTQDIAAEITRITTYGAHGVIVTAATKEAYATAPSFLRPGGTVVAVGLPKDPTVLAGAPPLLLCLKKLNIVGSVVGTLKDVEEALDFTSRGLVHVSSPVIFQRQISNINTPQPILTKGTIEEVDKYMDLMIAGKLAGRAVLKVS